MKSLKEAVKQQYFHRKKVPKAMIETRFYEHYFADAPAAVQETVVRVHGTAGAGSPQFNFVCKRLNKKYLRDMFMAVRFRDDFFRFLTTELLPNYKKKVESKVKKFIEQKVQCLLTRNNFSEAAIRQVCQEIRDNDKWKIPWTFCEARNAIREFEKDFGEASPVALDVRLNVCEDESI